MKEKEYKQINVSPEVHTRVKLFCTSKGLSIIEWIEKVINSALKKEEK